MTTIARASRVPRACRTSALAWVTAALCAVAGGCDFFSPRPAEPPATTAVCYYAQQSPDSVLADFKCALEAQTNGITNYGKLLDPDFTFTMDQGESLQLHIQSGTWSDSADKELVRSALSSVDSLSVLYEHPDTITSTPDEVVANVAYKMYYQVEDEAVDSLAGTAEITFKNITGLWYFDRWVDFRTGPHAWGYIKGRGTFSSVGGSPAALRSRRTSRRTW